MAEIGVVDAHTGVWCVGWAKWRAARSIPELPQQEPYDLNEDVETRADDAEGRKAPYSGRETIERARSTAQPLGQAVNQTPPPAHESKRVRHGGRARLAVLCVLVVIIITLGVGWAAISLDIIRIELMPPGAELLKQVEATLAGTRAVH
jgi:hypothetical protein